jgi:hypothetical protein
MRRASRPEIMVPQFVSFSPRGTDDRSAGWIVRLSIVGADVESLAPPPVGTEVDLIAKLKEQEIALHGRVQWSTQGQFGVQFGLLGVRETRAILETAESSGIG